MLSSREKQRVSEYLKTQHLEFTVFEEVLDHFLTEIEKQLILGKSFDDALQSIQQEFNPIQISIVNKNKQKINLMTKFKTWGIPSMVGSLFLAILIFKSINHNEGYSSPIPTLGALEIASPFGLRKDPRFKTKTLHSGIDYKAKTGTPIVSISSGEIIETVQSNKGYGNSIKIQHDDSTQSFYAHLNEIWVKKGEKVTSSDTIGTVGNSGLSSHPHLHLEVIKNGEKINPMLLFESNKSKKK